MTESSLEEEIQAQQSEDSDHVDEVATKDGEDAASKSEDEASRREFLLSAKEEILKQVGWVRRFFPAREGVHGD